jgi:hypothetical protein
MDSVAESLIGAERWRFHHFYCQKYYLGHINYFFTPVISKRTALFSIKQHCAVTGSP